MQKRRTAQEQGRVDPFPAHLLSASGAAVKVYLALCLAQPGGAFPGLRSLAEATSLARSTVSRALTELESSGTLVRDGGGFRLPARDGGFSVQEGAKNSTVLARARLPLEELQELEVPKGTSSDAGGFQVPALTLIEGQNLPFNALNEVCKVPKNRYGETGTALNGGRNVPIGIREQFAAQLQERNLSIDGEEFERALAAAVGVHAQAYRQTMPKGSLLTPIALAKWWSSLPAMYEGQREARPLTAAQKMMAKAAAAAKEL